MKAEILVKCRILPYTLKEMQHRFEYNDLKLVSFLRKAYHKKNILAGLEYYYIQKNKLIPALVEAWQFKCGKVISTDELLPKSSSPNYFTHSNWVNCKNFIERGFTLIEEDVLC